MGQAGAQALQNISQEVAEACASMLLQNAVDDSLDTVRAELRRLDEVVREVCRQRRSHKMLVHSSSEEEEGAEDGDKDEEMADVAEEEDEEEDDEDDEEEDEVRLTHLKDPHWCCVGGAEAGRHRRSNALGQNVTSTATMAHSKVHSSTLVHAKAAGFLCFVQMCCAFRDS